MKVNIPYTEWPPQPTRGAGFEILPYFLHNSCCIYHIVYKMKRNNEREQWLYDKKLISYERSQFYHALADSIQKL